MPDDKTLCIESAILFENRNNPVLLLLFVGFGQVDALRVWSDPLASLAHPGARDYGVGAMGKADTVMGRTGLSRRAKINNLHENPTKEFFLNKISPRYSGSGPTIVRASQLVALVTQPPFFRWTLRAASIVDFVSLKGGLPMPSLFVCPALSPTIVRASRSSRA